MDTVVFRYLNALAGHGALGDALIVFCASYLQYVLGAALVVLALWPPRRLRMAVAAIVSAIVARGLIKPLIVLAWHRARPFVALAAVHQLISANHGEEYASFPSGHAIFFFALAFAAYKYDRRLGWWLFAGATLMGIARVAAGVHWPSDILAGAALGMMTGYAVTRFVPSHA